MKFTISMSAAVAVLAVAINALHAVPARAQLFIQLPGSSPPGYELPDWPSSGAEVDLGDPIPYSVLLSGGSPPTDSEVLSVSVSFLMSGGLSIETGGTSTRDAPDVNFSGSTIAGQAGFNMPVFLNVHETTAVTSGTFDFDFYPSPIQLGTITVYDNPGSNPNNPIEVLPPGAVPVSPDKSRFKACPGCTPVGNGGVRGELGITDPGVAVASFQPSGGAGNEIYIDPEFASSYEIGVEAGGPEIASFILPDQADPYSVLFNGITENDILGGQVYQFPLGVTDFIVDGIDETTPFDGTEPAFTYGLTFYSDAPDIRDTDTVVDMTAFLSSTADVPEPGSLSLFAAGLTALGLLRRPKRS